MFKIVWKNFRSNIKNFLAFFISVIVSVGILFLFMYIQTAIKNIGRIGLYEQKLTGELDDVMRSLVPEIIIVAVVVIVYSVQFYIRSRIKDYSMLMILGIKQKEMRKFLVMEYAFGCTLACVLGLVLGRVITFFLGKGLEACVGNAFVAEINMSKVYKLTFLFCVLMIGIALFVISIILSEKNVSDLLKQNVIKEKRVVSKWCLVYLIVGSLLIFGSIALTIKFEDPLLEKIIMFILFLGIFIGGVLGTGYLFEQYRNKDCYYKKLLIWNQFYHHFNQNRYVIFVQTIIGIIILNFTFTLLSASIPFTTSKFQNDFLCMYETRKSFFEEFDKKYPGNNIELPFVWVNVDGMETRMGISLSKYNQIFDKQETLKEDEIISIKRDEYFWSLIDDSKNMLTPRMTIGENAEDVTRYKVKWEEELDIFEFQVEIGGLVILPDSIYEQARENDELQKSIALFDIDDQYLDQATDELMGNNALEKVFSKKEEIQHEREEKTLILVILVSVDIAIIFYSMFFMWLKLFAEMEHTKEKFDFLNVIGIRGKEKNKVLNEEIGLHIKVQIILVTVVSGLFIGARIWAKTYTGNIYEGLKLGALYYKELAVILVAYVVIQCLFLTIIRRWVRSRILEMPI